MTAIACISIYRMVSSLILLPCLCPTHKPETPHAQTDRRAGLFPKFEHDIRHLDILVRLIRARHLEDDILLMLRDAFLADRLHQLAQPAPLC